MHVEGRPGSIHGLAHRELVSEKTGEAFSRSSILTDFSQFHRLFVHHEVLEPGRRASGPHRHTHDEELVFVLEGEVVAHLGATTRRLVAGDFLPLPAGEKLYHWVENRSERPASLLVARTRDSQDRTLYESDAE